jgi:hypothetical protein
MPSEPPRDQRAVLKIGELGIWGGTTEKERKALKRAA